MAWQLAVDESSRSGQEHDEPKNAEVTEARNEARRVEPDSSSVWRSRQLAQALEGLASHPEP